MECYIVKTVNAYSGRFRKRYIENPLYCTNHKNLNYLQWRLTHFYEYFIDRRPVSAPTWPNNELWQYKLMSQYRNIAFIEEIHTHPLYCDRQYDWFKWRADWDHSKRLTAWSRVLLEKLTVPHLVKNSHLMEKTYHYRIQNSGPLVPILSQVKPITTVLLDDTF